MNRTRGFPSTTGIHPKEFDICAARPVISVAMSAIAQAIADRQNAIDRLSRDQGVDRCRADAWSVRAGAGLRASALLAEEDRRRGEQARGQAAKKAPAADGQGEEGGIGAHDRLLGRTEEEGREVARHRPRWVRCGGTQRCDSSPPFCCRHSPLFGLPATGETLTPAPVFQAGTVASAALARPRFDSGRLQNS